MLFLKPDDGDEEELDDEETPLADDVLAEVEDEAIAPDDLEGFGLVDEVEEEAVADEEKEEEEDTADSLEEDAEDVDFDTFDDVDET